jgi:hypothetical protein
VTQGSGEGGFGGSNTLGGGAGVRSGAGRAGTPAAAALEAGALGALDPPAAGGAPAAPAPLGLPAGTPAGTPTGVPAGCPAGCSSRRLPQCTHLMTDGRSCPPQCGQVFTSEVSSRRTVPLSRGRGYGPPTGAHESNRSV